MQAACLRGRVRLGCSETGIDMAMKVDPCVMNILFSDLIMVEISLILSCLHKCCDVLSSHISVLKCRFEIVGYGCSTCVGNTAPLSEAVLNAVKQVNVSLKKITNSV